MTKQLDLDALRAAAEAATQGPWKTDDPYIVYAEIGDEIIYLANTSELDTKPHQFVKDAAYIAAANPAVVLALIDRLRKAEAAREWQPIQTAPKDGTLVLLAAEFDCKGDWRKKVGGYWDCCWHVFGGSWEPTRWTPLPPDPEGSDLPAAPDSTPTDSAEKDGA